MVQLVAAHRGKVEFEPLEVNDEGRRQLLDRAPSLRRDTLPAFLAKVTIVSLYFSPQPVRYSDQ